MPEPHDAVLKSLMPNFPLVSKQSLSEAFNSIQINASMIRRQITPIQRRKKFSDLSEADLSHLKALQDKLDTYMLSVELLEDMLQDKHWTEHQATEQVNFYKIYNLCDAIDSSEKIKQQLHQYERYLSDETNPIIIFKAFAMDNPIEYAAALIYLFMHGYQSEQIISSGLLHHYVQSNAAFSLENIAEAYQIFEHNIQKSDDIEYFLNAIKIYSAHIGDTNDYFKTFSLEGRFQVTENKEKKQTRQFQTVQIKSLSSQIHYSYQNLHNLYQLFGFVFLNRIIEHMIDNSDESIILFVDEMIKGFDVNDLKSFIDFFVSNSNHVSKIHCMKMLNQFARPENMQTLFLKDEAYRWLFLSTNTNHLKSLSSEQIESLVRQPLDINSLNLAIQLCQYPQLATFKDELFEQAFNILMNKPCLIEQKEYQSTIDMLSKSSSIMTHCEQKLVEMQTSIYDLINKAHPFTIESYQAISDAFATLKIKYRVIKRISNIPCIYAFDTYSLSSLVIETLYELKAPSFNIDSMLEVLITERNLKRYDELSQKNACIRILLECLIKTKDESLQKVLIASLTNTFEVSLLHQTIQDKPILYLASLEVNKPLVDYLLCELEAPDLLLKRLNEVSQELQKNDGYTWLMSACCQPLSFEYVLSLYPEAYRFQALNEKNRLLHGSALDFVLQNPKYLEIIIALIPDFKTRLYSENGHGIFLKAAKNAISLQLLLDLMDENEWFDILNRKDIHQESILHKACTNPEALTLVLNNIPENNRLDALLSMNQYGLSALFKSCENREVLEKIIQSLSLDELENLKKFLETKNDFGADILHKTSSHPESFKRILALYSHAHLKVNFNNVDNYGNSVFFKSCKHISSLAQLLKEMGICDIINALSFKRDANVHPLATLLQNPDAHEMIINFCTQHVTDKVILINAQIQKSLNDLSELLIEMDESYLAFKCLSKFFQSFKVVNIIDGQSTFNQQLLGLLLTLTTDALDFETSFDSESGDREILFHDIYQLLFDIISEAQNMQTQNNASRFFATEQVFQPIKLHLSNLDTRFQQTASPA